MARFLLSLCLVVLAGAPCLRASAPPQCVRATLSQNKVVLVLNDLFFADPRQQSGSPQRSSFRVYLPMVEPSDRLRVNSSQTAWNSPLWQVDFPSNSTGAAIPLCSSVLITDDAEFLILLGTGRQALTIFRRPHLGTDRNGVFVQRIAQQELGVPIPFMTKGNTPAWYAGGRFVLSTTRLLFIDRGHRQFHIDLASGLAKETRPRRDRNKQN